MKRIGRHRGKELERWYWSSSDYSFSGAYALLNSTGCVVNGGLKTDVYWVRFILDLN